MSLKAVVYALTDVGKQREHNEDNFLVDEQLRLYVVADGMGGAAAGEVASAEACKFVKNYISGSADVVVACAKDPSPENRNDVQFLLESAIQGASRHLFEMGQAERSRRGMGCTIDCLLVVGEWAVIGHVGDSRVYQFRDNNIHRLTEDHTLLHAQLKAGLITKEQAATSAWRSVLLHAVGVQESVPVDTLWVQLAPGDRYLLCSDGLHGQIEDSELPALMAVDDLPSLPKRLIDLANERGGPDNITAVVVTTPAADGTDPRNDAAAMMQLLQSIPLFAELNHREQAAVLAVSTAHRCPANHEVVREGTRGEDLYFVVAGRLQVIKEGHIVNEIGPSDLIGEMSIIGETFRSATVKSLEPTRMIKINRGHLLAVMRKNPVLAVKILWKLAQTLSDRLARANQELVQAHQKLATSDEPFITFE